VGADGDTVSGCAAVFWFFWGLFGGSPLVEQTLRDLCHPDDIAAADTSSRHLRYDSDRIDQDVVLYLCTPNPNRQKRCVADDKALESDSLKSTESWMEKPAPVKPPCASGD
jgi:hypothetical protein